MPKEDLVSLAAKHGEKMIEVSVRFWTNDIATDKGRLIPKHAWTAGMIRLSPNKSHNVTSGRWIPFHSLLDIGAIIEKALIEQGVVLHASRKMQKYTAHNGNR